MTPVITWMTVEGQGLGPGLPARLEGHRRKAPEAGELAEVDADRQRAREAEAHQRRGVPAVLEHPRVDNVAIQEGTDHEQRPPLCTVKGLLTHSSMPQKV